MIATGASEQPWSKIVPGWEISPGIFPSSYPPAWDPLIRPLLDADLLDLLNEPLRSNAISLGAEIIWLKDARSTAYMGNRRSPKNTAAVQHDALV